MRRARRISAASVHGGALIRVAVLFVCAAAGCRGLELLEDPPVAPPPAVSDPLAVRFLAVGDTGLGNRDQHRVAKAMAGVCEERGCDFALLLGDNLYPRGMQVDDDPRMDEVVTDVYTRVGVPFYGVLGNHDWGRGRDRAAAMRQVAWAADSEVLVMPDRYYRFSASFIDFFALDTTPIFWRDDLAQASWLGAALRASDAPFKVVFGHHAFRSDAKHGNAGDYEGLGFIPLVGGASLKGMFEQHVCPEADLYVAGHDHVLQWIRHCDTDLVVSGAGASTRPLVDRGNDPLFAAAELGFAWIEVAATATDAEGRGAPRSLAIAFYGADGQHLFEASQAFDAGASRPVPAKN